MPANFLWRLLIGQHQQKWYVFVAVKNRRITPGGEKYNTREESMYTKGVIGVCAMSLARHDLRRIELFHLADAQPVDQPESDTDRN